jgi:hypothetical protein
MSVVYLRYKAYGGSSKIFVEIPVDHNTQRPPSYYRKVLLFLHHILFDDPVKEQTPDFLYLSIYYYYLFVLLWVVNI